MADLKDLKIDFSKIEDVRPLRGLALLKKLNITNYQSSMGLSLPSLEALELSNSKTSADITIKELPQVKHFVFSSCAER